ncbi:Acyl-coenzyme A thioesterase PaaI, contains HGG motif [Solimonas aquatica]|uniref:Acyl-coenzyme A thioesterase PaaI, contains HGG motif n=1 Tax=Solimonas aquatica TaxID=489703 RepID=A0A1H9F8I9_9GAMM|nr:DUF4442 domain-containing protein [Solimonas aquatica]SEQ33598.1 Acyl-coenzyme A thioesterase PaaI, contains HGG motif [Solimonas aquatica]
MSRNLLSRVVAQLERLPAPLARRALTLAFNSQVRFAGTGGARFEHLSATQAIVHMANRRKVRNHIGGIHAAAMALLAETTSGAVFGMNVPDDKLPLLKSMHVDYQRRAQGALKATATLDAGAAARIAAEPKGEMVVPVRVQDESGEAPIAVTMVWAWVEKRRG